jgi:hypothetical protein
MRSDRQSKTAEAALFDYDQRAGSIL